MMATSRIVLLSAALLLAASVGSAFAQSQGCSDTTTAKLYAGQTKEVGTLTVKNATEDGEKYLYVTYIFNQGVTVYELHLWVGTDLKNMPQTKPLKGEMYGNPIPGKFPYDMYDATMQNGSYVFKIKLADVFGESDPCGKTVLVVAHAKVWVGGMEETAFAGSGPCYITPPGRWWCYVSHVICCDQTTPPPEGCWKDETAWAKGDPYNPGKGGNWAMYVTYSGTSMTVDLLAGQTMDAGNVTLEPVSTGVKITVDMGAGWRFAPVPDNLKVQGYNSPPSGNPAPGQFANKKTCDPASNSCFIVVPYAPYYGIHVDVQKSVPCTE